MHITHSYAEPAAESTSHFLHAEDPEVSHAMDIQRQAQWGQVLLLPNWNLKDNIPCTIYILRVLKKWNTAERPTVLSYTVRARDPSSVIKTGYFHSHREGARFCSMVCTINSNLWKKKFCRCSLLCRFLMKASSDLTVNSICNHVVGGFPLNVTFILPKSVSFPDTVPLGTGQLDSYRQT